MKRPKRKLTEAQIVRALKRLERGWPVGYQLFVASGASSLQLTKITNDPDVDEDVECFAIPSYTGDLPL